MPRSGVNGTYTLPGAQKTQQPLTTIPSAVNNAGWSDVEQTFNTIQPEAYGGTGASTFGGAADNLSPAFVNVASGSTTNIGAATSPNVNITGTTTITAFGNVTAGIKRFVKFSGALTLTHNATSLILPGAGNITTTAGDTAIFVSEGSGNWRCLGYLPSAPVPNTLNGQYRFPATQNPSFNPNTLDDYEEGTFIPTDASSAGLTFTSSDASYTKIGRVVFWQMNVTYPATASGSSAAIGGFPFTVNNSAGARASCYIGFTPVSAPRYIRYDANSTLFRIFDSSGVAISNSQLSGAGMYFAGHFIV